MALNVMESIGHSITELYCFAEFAFVFKQQKQQPIKFLYMIHLRHIVLYFQINCRFFLTFCFYEWVN